MVNIQDPSVFDSQLLNRDLWKDPDVQSAINAHFVFLQYDRQSRQGAEYIQLYMAGRLEGDKAYPHIGIIDPRTGELLKSLTANPVPKPADFLMLVYEFLDRYSLLPDARNPVARRKPPAQPDVARLSEEDMVRIAMENSLAATSGPGAGGADAPPDPDELTRSRHADQQRANGTPRSPPSSPRTARSSAAPSSAWSRIASDRPHVEPAADAAPAVATTRIQFRWSGGRQVRRFGVGESVRRVYEWLKAAPPDPTWDPTCEFELIFLGQNLIGELDRTIAEVGLMNGTVMVEFRGNGDEE
jgi:UBX domain-containing protein 7